MNDTSHASVAGLYAIRLQPADSSDTVSIAGRLEHVLSGRLQEFDCGEALLACLAREQGRAYSMSDSPASTPEARVAAPATGTASSHDMEGARR